MKFIVVLLEFNLPSGGVGTNFVGFTLICQVVVIGPDDDRYGGSSEQVGLVLESAYNS
jgi:hypothetical protein